jgi:hypothetical protein
MTTRFLEIPPGHLIDLSRVEYVSPVTGDAAYRRYNVTLRSGKTLAIHETREDRDTGTMPRAEFVKWLQRWENAQ